MKIDRRKVYDLFNGHCAYCGCELENESGKFMQVDHIEPLRRNWFKKDGSCLNPENDHGKNLFPACLKCNNYKGSFGREEFRSMLKNTPNVLKNITPYRNALRFGMIEVKEWDGVFYFEKQIKL